MGCAGVTAAARPRERRQGSPWGLQKGGTPRLRPAGDGQDASPPPPSPSLAQGVPARPASCSAASEIKPVTQVLPRTEREQGEEMGTFNDDCAEALG